MRPTFTPGPWEALPPVKSEDRVVYVQVRAKQARLATICVYGKDEKNQPAGEKHKDRFGDERHVPTITGAEAVATARLIAAAPDLYAALRDLRDAWCLNACDAASPDEGMNHLPECYAARDALEKAVGR